MKKKDSPYLVRHRIERKHDGTGGADHHSKNSRLVRREPELQQYPGEIRANLPRGRYDHGVVRFLLAANPFNIGNRTVHHHLSY